MSPEATINGDTIVVRTGSELASILGDFSASQYLEVWVTRDGESMCMLANGDRAWLMYLKNIDEECFTTRSDDIVDQNEYLDFRLSNGQADEYPAYWTVKLAHATNGIAHFFDQGGRTTSLTWHDDFKS